MTAYGRAMLREFPLDPAITYLNHGTVGVTPIRSLLAQQAIRDEIERQPSRFQLRELTAVRVGGERTEPPRMRQASRCRRSSPGSSACSRSAGACSSRPARAAPG